MSASVLVFRDGADPPSYSLSPSPGSPPPVRYALPEGYEARAGSDGLPRLYGPDGRPAGPHRGRWGGPCVRTPRGGLRALEPEPGA